MVDITVVVPTRNAASVLEGCLESIRRNEPTDLIVVDGSSTDATLEIAGRFGARTLDDGGRGLPVARSLGVAAATTRWVALVDSDVIVPDGALEALVDECAAGGYAALQAGQESVGGPGYWGRALAYHHRMGRSRRWFGVVATVAERDTLLAIGFDATFLSGEDIELRMRLQGEGRKIGVSERTSVTHRFAGDDFAYAREQWLADGEGLGRTVAKFGWRAAWLLLLPILASVRGSVLALVRLRPQWLPYFACYLAFNYVGLLRAGGTAWARTLRRTSDDDDSRLSMLGNSLALSGARVGTMVLGFLFWLLAARTFPAGEVGLAAAVIAAMMLCVQLAQLGLGPACLIEHHRPVAAVDDLVATASRIALVAGTVVALGSVAVVAAVTSGDEGMGVIAADWPMAGAFVVLTVLSSWNFFLDHAQLALGDAARGLTRNLAASTVTLVVLVGAAITGFDGALTIVVAWVVGMAVATALGVAALRQRAAGTGGALRWSTARRLVATGLPNHLLSLTERLPGYVLPIVVVGVLSSASNAVWYTVWMMAWAAYFVPQSVGVALLAEVSLDPTGRSEHVRRALQTASKLGLAVALVLAVVGPGLLLLLGDDYGDGIVPLWILLLAVLPASFVQVYLAVSRSARRFVEANIAGATLAAVAIGAGWIGADRGELEGLATGWLVAQLLGALWAGTRLARSRREPVPGVGSGEPPLHAARSATAPT